MGEETRRMGICMSNLIIWVIAYVVMGLICGMAYLFMCYTETPRYKEHDVEGYINLYLEHDIGQSIIVAISWIFILVVALFYLIWRYAIEYVLKTVDRFLQERNNE